MKDQFKWDVPLVYRVLRDCGWMEDRSIDVSSWVVTLGMEGYAIFSEAKEILSSFGQLRIVPPVLPGAKFYSGELFFDPIWAATGERARITRREQELGCRLVPLGEWIGEYIVLLGDDGKVFAETTFQVLQLGETFVKAIQTVITGDHELRDVTPIDLAERRSH